MHSVSSEHFLGPFRCLSVFSFVQTKWIMLELIWQSYFKLPAMLTQVCLDWAVQHVDYGAHGVKLQSSDGRIVTADYVILTVPVVRQILM